MAISGALNNALTGLSASSRMAEVVSSNLSNALTEGYARRTVELSSVQVGDVGGGVRIDGINRLVDPGLLGDRRLADAAFSGQQRTSEMLGRLEGAIGKPDDQGNLASRLAAVEAALIRASADPASQERLDTVVRRMDELAQELRDNSRTVQQQRAEADSMIARDVADLNRTLQNIATLNIDILRVSASGDDVSALLDARQREVDSIAQIVPIRETVRDNGTVRLMTTSGLTLLDGRPAEFTFVPTPTITGDMTFESGALSGIQLDGASIDLSDGVGRLDGGSLGAAFAMRDRTLPELQAAMDSIAADLISRFEDPTNDPTVGVGGLGVFTDEGDALDPGDIAGLASRIALNADVDPLSGGQSAVIRDGLAGGVSSGPGDPTQINRWIDAMGAQRAGQPGDPAKSLAARSADYIAQLGSTRFDADSATSFASARLDTLLQAELADGVDTDKELQTLIRVEQFYAANAKVIETVDFMMRRLMEI